MEQENKELTIEESFAQLDSIIGKMQAGELSLEETFAMYKEGIALVEGCHQKIEKIQCDIQKLNTDTES